MVAASSTNLPLRFGVFELDLNTGELRKSGRAVRLRPQAAKVLRILATRPGQLVTREDLQAQLWGQETFVDFEHSINLCIREIRTALSDDAATPRYVETLPRQGYRFIAAIQDPQLAKDPSIHLQRPAIPTTPITPVPRRSYWLAALVGVVILAIGLLWPALSKLGLGRLPGDIVVERGNYAFYFPVVTCIILSVVLSVIWSLFSR